MLDVRRITFKVNEHSASFEHKYQLEEWVPEAMQIEAVCENKALPL